MGFGLSGGAEEEVSSGKGVPTYTEVPSKTAHF